MEKTIMSFNIGKKKWEKTVYLPTKLCEWMQIFAIWSSKRFPYFITWKPYK